MSVVFELLGGANGPYNLKPQNLLISESESGGGGLGLLESGACSHVNGWLNPTTLPADSARPGGESLEGVLC